MNIRRIQTGVGLLFVALSLVSLAAFVQGAEQAPAPRAADEDFFIVSSVDLKQQQIVLKRPTEVTQLVKVSDKTAIRDEEGKTIPLKTLRAGDTVYVAEATAPDGSRLATRIHKAPMTVEELHRRYVPFQ
ncbi:MAG: hypothetical protein LAO07_00330 [Acidobacteriia bacterium]|nr:hypothetical protein [Terriglobia bacterium]